MYRIGTASVFDCVLIDTLRRAEEVPLCLAVNCDSVQSQMMRLIYPPYSAHIWHRQMRNCANLRWLVTSIPLRQRIGPLRSDGIKFGDLHD